MRNIFCLNNNKRRCLCVSFIFRKIDSVTEEGLPNALFRLTGCCCMPIFVRSDAQGSVRFDGLLPGCYLLEEVTPPTGYLPSTVQHLIEIDCCGCIFVDGMPADNFVIRNTAQSVSGSFNVYKITEDGSPLSGATYALSQDDVPLKIVTTNEAGIAYFSQVMPGSYTLVETVAPVGYELNTTENLVVVAQNGAVTINDTVTNTLTVTDERILTSVSGIKTWIDNGNQNQTRPDQVIINLYQNGTLFRQMVIDTSENMFTFDGLPKYDSEGMEYIYTIDEATTPAGYHKIVSGTTITNSLMLVVVTVILYDSTNSIELARDYYQDYYGSSLTVYAPVLVGYTLQSPSSHTFTRLTADETHYFYYTANIANF